MLNPQDEEKILAFWRKNNIFNKTLAQTRKGKPFVFFEGPPTANGRPGIHHLLARALKDLYPRFWTMRGRYVLRKAGWDTHGLPVELEVEKELGLNSKKEIEAYGIARFNEKCRRSVWRYKDEWEKLTRRIGFWLDLNQPYVTYEASYIESLWAIMKHIWERGLFTKDVKVVPYCPRCGTGLSSHELAQGYARVQDPSIYLKLPVKKSRRSFLILWTTTPWTIPGNVAAAVNPEIAYVKVRLANGERWYLAKQRLKIIDQPYKVVAELKGEKLIGLAYEHPYPIPGLKKAYQVFGADFVSAEEGSGIVHIAPAYGEDDLELARAHRLPLIVHTDEAGRLTSQRLPGRTKQGPAPAVPVLPGQGRFIETANAPIIKDLVRRGFLVRKETISHDYPFCWRCKTRLIYFIHKTWFIAMRRLRAKMQARNQKINWLPEHVREGRFGEWLRELKDWAFSRDRYWGTPLPIWTCPRCRHQICLGSFRELRRRAQDKQKARRAQADPHRPFIDEVKIPCQKCAGVMRREPYVVDVWFDSGAMPFAQWHYPFENKERVDGPAATVKKRPRQGQLTTRQYPADFIAEGLDQTRGWFYTLLAVSTLYEKPAAFRNVIAHGLVLDSRGRKMSKSRGNIIRPWEQIDKYGADAIRWYFYVVNEPSLPKRYNEKEIRAHRQRFLATLAHSVQFARLVSTPPRRRLPLAKPRQILDRWLLSRFSRLTRQVTEHLEQYASLKAARALEEFVDDLSNWHIRRSRTRLKENLTGQRVLTETLYRLLILTAPFVPLTAEAQYQELRTLLDKSAPESIHLAGWPEAVSRDRDPALEQEMARVRQLAREALALRRAKALRVRQPLSRLTIYGPPLAPELQQLLAEEVNVKTILHKKSTKDGPWLELDTRLTPALIEEGARRELLRAVQALRRQAGLKPGQPATLHWQASDKLAEFIKKQAVFLESETSVSLKRTLPRSKTKAGYLLEIFEETVEIFLK